MNEMDAWNALVIGGAAVFAGMSIIIGKLWYELQKKDKLILDQNTHIQSLLERINNISTRRRN